MSFVKCFTRVGRNVSSFILKIINRPTYFEDYIPSCLDICKESQDYNPIIETYNKS